MTLQPGDTLQGGKYRIEKVLGQGGFGTTYKAWHRDLKQWVVLKTHNEHLIHDPDYEKYVARFVKEGQMMARLAEKEVHSNLVRVLDLFSEPVNYHYLVMNFVEGENLFAVVKRRGKLPEAEVISIAQQIGGALVWMHEHQCVHRDAHPGNIMLSPDGRAILIDLGGAKEFVPSSQSSVGIVGNKGFAPYEQIISPEKSRHPSGDIFCFAGTLYFAITSEKPANSLARKMYGEVLAPPQQLTNISDAVSDMLMAGLELEASDRPQSIQAWLSYIAPKPQPTKQPVQTLQPEIVSPKPSVPVRSLSPQEYPEFTKSSVSISNFFVSGEFTKPSVSTTSASPPKRRATSRSIPWGWLVGCMVAYTLIGLGLSIKLQAVAWAVAMYVAVAWAVAGTVDVDVYVAGALVGARTAALARVWARTMAVAGVLAVAGAWALVGFWRGSWEWWSGSESLVAGLWWVIWPMTLGIVPARAAEAIQKIKDRKFLAIFFPTVASWLGLALGWWIYRQVHPT